MQRIVNEGQTFVRREITDDDALVELADEPYKCELIGLKGGAPRTAAEGASVEVGGARADHLRQPAPRRHPRLGRPVPRPARAHHQAARQRLQADAQRRRLLARLARRTRSCSASTAPPGRPRTTSRPTSTGWPRPRSATTASSAPSSTCSPSPTSWARAWRSSTPRAASSSARWRTTSAGGTSRRGSSTSAPRTSPRTACSTPRDTCRTTPTRCSRRWSSRAAKYRLKAMNCPMHNLIFRSRGRSYRELPLRLFEFGSVYRYEKSGVVHGLTRVRGMTQDDSHSYVTAEQAPAEIKHLLDFVLGAAARLRARRLLPRAVHPGQGDKKDKFIGSDEEWEIATDVLARRRDRVRPRAGPRPGWRRLLRPEDLGAGPRRDRPHLADVDHPVRLQPAGAASGSSTRRPTAPASSR